MVIQFFILLLLALPALGQTPASPSSTGSSSQSSAQKSASDTPQDPLGRISPKGTVVGFLTAAHRADWQSAVQYLDTSLKGDEAVELASQLAVVLDQGLPANLDQLSKEPEGNLNDKLPPSKELVGTIETNGGPLDVILERTRRSVWLFAPETLKEIPAVYDEFNSTWIPEHLPHLLLRRGFLGMPLWQWLALLVGLIFASMIAGAARKISIPLLRRLLHSLGAGGDEWILDRLMGPLRALLALIVVHITISILRLPLFPRMLWSWIGLTLTILSAGWLFVRCVQVAGKLVGRLLERRGGADATAVIRLGERTLNLLAAFVVVVLLLQYVFHKDVSTLLTGLGIGGVALAFAAQKTLENLFGGVSIIFDKPIRVGDACNVASTTGVVEDIGLRSTSFRTNDRTVLSVPNGQLSTMSIENLSMRDKFWFRHVACVRIDTTSDQMKTLLEALRKMLADHPLIERDSSRVRLIKITTSSIDLELWAYILTTDGLKFLAIQEELLLGVLMAVEASGTHMAIPSQRLYMDRLRTEP